MQVPYTLIQQEIRKKKIYVLDMDGKRVHTKASQRLESPCAVHIPDYFDKVNNELLNSINFHSLNVSLEDRIIFHDDHLIVVNKPQNVICQRTRDNTPSIISVLQKAFSSPLIYPLHRLDRNTTGVLLLARDRETARCLSHEFACRRVHKQYVAAGYDVSFSSCYHPRTGLILSDMMKDERGLYHVRNATIQEIHGGVFPDNSFTSSLYPAATGYEVVNQNHGVVVLRCKLYSGKTHQIRVHLKDVLGIEVLNDAKYGRRRKLDVPIDLRAMYLHCQQIIIRYQGEDRIFSAPLPQYFSNLMNSL